MRGDKRERILRALLSSKEALSKSELSKRAECTRQWVILFLKELEKKRLVKGTSSIDRKKLLQYLKNVNRATREKVLAAI